MKKSNASQFVVTKVICESYKSPSNRTKIPRLFVDVGSIIKVKTVADMLSLRKVTFSRADVAVIKAGFVSFLNTNFATNLLSPLTVDDVNLRWSRYAGCSCPCSPGFIVDFSVGDFSKKCNGGYYKINSGDVYYCVDLGLAVLQDQISSQTQTQNTVQ